MPLGDALIELGLRFLFEFVFYGATYWTGYLILKIFSLGRLDIAPFLSLGDQNQGKVFDLSIWLNRDFQPKVLKMEAACFVGLLFWIASAAMTYLILFHAPGLRK